jgi:hypothetical protein
MRGDRVVSHLVRADDRLNGQPALVIRPVDSRDEEISDAFQQRVELCQLGAVLRELVVLRENGTFLSFPYVCPEPVLVK